jgi:hypothetical protein
MAALLLTLSCALAAEPQPPEVTEARRYIQAAAVLFGALDNKRALEQLARAKAVPHSVEDDVLISLYEGLIQSDNGRAEESEAAFRAAFALDPEAALPIPVSPKLEASIERIRQEVKKTLARTQRVTPPPQQPPPKRVEEAPPAAVAVVEPPAPSRAWVGPAVVGAALLAGAAVFLGLEQGVEGRLRAADASIMSRAQLDGVYGDGHTFFITSTALAVSGALALVVAAVLLAVR